MSRRLIVVVTVVLTMVLPVVLPQPARSAPVGAGPSTPSGSDPPPSASPTSPGTPEFSDSKNQDRSSTGNTVRDCVVTGTTGDGIELFSSSRKTVTGCAISHVGGHGLQY